MESYRAFVYPFLQQDIRRLLLQYSANCNTVCKKFILCGLLPSEIEKRFPEYWFNDNEEGNKNEHERDFLEDQMKRLGLSGKHLKYLKILNADFERKIYEDFNQHKNNDL